MTMPSVVLDACVLIPYYLRDTLLTTAEAGLYMPYWSQKILDETTRNIVLIAKKALSLLGRQTGEGGRYLDGERKILQVKNGRIQGNLSSADIEAFQIFAQS
jgi:hypothetical protein